MTRVTVIGLGDMGCALAETLHAAGCDLTVWNRSPERPDHGAWRHCALRHHPCRARSDRTGGNGYSDGGPSRHLVGTRGSDPQAGARVGLHRCGCLAPRRPLRGALSTAAGCDVRHDLWRPFLRSRWHSARRLHKATARRSASGDRTLRPTVAATIPKEDYSGSGSPLKIYEHAFLDGFASFRERGANMELSDLFEDLIARGMKAGYAEEHLTALIKVLREP